MSEYIKLPWTRFLKVRKDAYEALGKFRGESPKRAHLHLVISSKKQNNTPDRI